MSAIWIAPAGHADPIAVRTRPVVSRTRRDGREITLLPATSADAATTVGTHTGEFAACQPNTTPYGAHSRIVSPVTAGTARGLIASAKSGSASSSASAESSSRRAKRIVWPLSRNAASTMTGASPARASRDRPASSRRSSMEKAATAG